MDEPIIEQYTTIYGCPIKVEVTLNRTGVVDVTHALRTDGNRVVLDTEIVRNAIEAARARGLGLHDCGVQY